MNTTDLRSAVSMLRDIATRLGFADGVENVLDNGDEAHTMGDYERRHLGIGDFHDEIPSLIAMIVDDVNDLATISDAPRGHRPDFVTEAERKKYVDECWTSYVSGFNKGVRAVNPKALESGED